MALISFFSAKGAPGATTTAMLVAALWPRPTLLVDADGAGGDVALRLTASSGASLTRSPGLLTLLPLARHGLAPSVVLDHTQVAMGGQRVLVGLENPGQAEAAGALWPTLAQAFDDLPGMDVIIDAGQVSARSGQLSLLQRSDLVVGVLRAEPTSVVHMRQRMRFLAESFAPLAPDAPRLGLVCVEHVQEQGEASSAVGTVAEEVGDLLDLGQVALDRKAVRIFHGEPVFRPERSMLVRSGQTLVQTLLAAAGPTLSPPAGSEAPQAGESTADSDDQPVDGAAPVDGPQTATDDRQTAADGPQTADQARTSVDRPEVAANLWAAPGATSQTADQAGAATEEGRPERRTRRRLFR